MTEMDSIFIKEEPQIISPLPVTHGNTEELIIHPEATVTTTTPYNIKQELEQTSSSVLQGTDESTQESVWADYSATATEPQRLLLLSHLKEAPELCNNRTFLEGETAAQRRAKWDRIAATLNAVGAFHKDGKGWQQLWKDWRYRVRNRAREMTRKMQAAGGGSGHCDEGATPVDISSHLSRLDQRVMALVGWNTAGGLAGGTKMSTENGMMEETLPVSAPPQVEPLTSTSASPAAAEESTGTEQATAPPASNGRHQGTGGACRRRRRRIPPSVTAQVLKKQEQLLEEQRKLVGEQKKMVECMTTLCQRLTPVSEYFSFLLEKERANSSQ